jgi:anti-sigma factor RsiW
MSHNPELDAANYLAGEMSAKRAHAFEQHLLECEECWREVSEAREGRALVESARELAPAGFREDVRAAIAAYEPAHPRRTRARLAIAAAIVLLAAGVSTVLVVRSPGQPVAIAEAVADFRTGRLPVAGAPRRPAPDLSAIGLELATSGAGDVGDLSIDAYAYRDAAGRRVLLYLSDRPFPVAAGARHTDGADSPWTARDGDVELMCAQHPEAMLLLSGQRDTLERVAEAMGAL